ncbi:hypothetical protein KCP75_24210 [Salmonella enterica subsp. enterica]|nr:hypothetical protein KCP75_24210 [Salmonella enterica subsp. enterica]
MFGSLTTPGRWRDQQPAAEKLLAPTVIESVTILDTSKVINHVEGSFCCAMKSGGRYRLE